MRDICNSTPLNRNMTITFLQESSDNKYHIIGWMPNDQ